MLHRPRLLALGGVLLLAIAAGAGGYALTRPPALVVTGTQVDLPVPQVRLTDQHGAPFTLADLHGKVVVIFPFLTDCHEICPLTTAAFLQMQAAIDAASLADRVALVEITVDPGRDTPERLAAYAKLASANWTMLTGTQADLDRLWGFFGISVQKEPVASPALIDWYTNQPETYDMTHTPVLIFLDAQGRERIVLVGTADVHDSIPAQLESMLNTQGHEDLHSPSEPWTPQQALDNVSVLLGVPRIEVPAN
jgi:protein SCO1/2